MKYMATEMLVEARPVAPLAGARIEIAMAGIIADLYAVAPLAGARIEITPGKLRADGYRGRSPRGSAD